MENEPGELVVMSLLRCRTSASRKYRRVRLRRA